MTVLQPFALATFLTLHLLGMTPRPLDGPRYEKRVDLTMVGWDDRIKVRGWLLGMVLAD